MRSAAVVLIPALLWAQTADKAFEGLQIERVTANSTFYDGILWTHAGYLLVADVPGKRLLRFDPGEKSRFVEENNGGIQGIAQDARDRIYFCESAARRVSRQDKPGGKVEVVAAEYQGKKFNGPNDITVRKDGQVYFTDPAFGTAQDRMEIPFHGIFYVTPKGELATVAEWKTRPNGIALSPDGKVLYVADSDRHAVVAFDLDRNGAASNERVLVKGIPGVPGGIRTDVQGRLYVAAQHLEIYTSAGKHIHTILLSEPAVNCAFGQNDLESLFIATRKALYRVQLKVKGSVQY